MDAGTATTLAAGAAGAIPVTGWISAAVAVVGAAASIAGLFRYFASQSRPDGTRPDTPETSGTDEGWTPVFGHPEG